MSGGGQTTNQSSSTQNSLPSWLTTPYQNQVGSAGQLLDSGLGTTATGPAMLGQGMNAIGAVNPTSINAANGSLTDVLNGGYFGGANSTMGAANPAIASEASGALMNPNSNPYLGSMYNLGLQGIENNVDSQFGAAGRNVLSGAPVQTDQASTLASQLLGGQYGNNLNATLNAQQLASGNYNTGINAMNQASAISPSVTSGQYTPGNEFLSAGQTPYNLSSWYQNILGGAAAPFGQSTSTGQSRTTNQLSTSAQVGAGIGALASIVGMFA